MGKLKVIAKPGKYEIVMTRDFDAPLELAFKAYTDPNLILEWRGRRKDKTTVDMMGVRDGGRRGAGRQNSGDGGKSSTGS